MLDEKVKVSSPRYLKIAQDIAAKISSGHYKEGDKIYARSYVASQYGVSSETARRALAVLSDLDIVEIKKGSGVTIKSRKKAGQFVEKYANIQTVQTIKKELLNSLDRQQDEMKFFNESLSKLIKYTDNFKAINPFIPYEIEIDGTTPLLGKTIADINLWHNTSATVVAIKRDDVLLMSPGPYATFIEGDVFYYNGDEKCREIVNQFVYPVN